jgi:glycosyltransferase involved in cell wall biosynthesis
MSYAKYTSHGGTDVVSGNETFRHDAAQRSALTEGPYLTESLSIVIPVYNSESSLPLLVERLASLLPGLAKRFEVILVNDDSRDRSAAIVENICHEREWVVGIHLMRNSGQHHALLAGIRQAQYETIVTMDDDLQNPPEEIRKLLARLAEGMDVVYGYPERESHGVWRNLASRLTKLTLQAAMGVTVASHVSSFRAFRSQVQEAFSDYRGSFVSVDVLLSWATTRFAAIPVSNPPRTLGTSTYTLRKLITHALNMVTGFSVLPLQFASMLGFTFAAFGLCALAWVLARYFLQGNPVPGFPFLASVVSIFSGVQLFCLGILGEYLARMHFRLLNRPSYTIRSTTRNVKASTATMS